MHSWAKSIEENMIRVLERQKKALLRCSTLVIWSDFNHRPEEDTELTKAENGSELADETV